MFTRNTIRSLSGVAAVALVVAGCDSAVSPHQTADGANLSRAEAHAYDAWTLAVSIETTPGTSSAFNTPAAEGCPNISRDGKTFYFASNRLGSFGLDIWVSTRDQEGDGWGSPTRVSAPVNAPAVAAGAQINDFCPSITRDDHLFFFASNRPYADAYGNVPCGGDDLYVTRRRDDGTFEEPRNLGCDVNSAANEQGPFLIEEPGRGRVLYFSSFRSGGAFPDAGPTSDSDLYSSELDGESFGTPQLVPGVNSERDDGQPNLRRDALELYFYSTRTATSTRDGTLGLADIFVATRASAHDPWEMPVNLGPNVNTALGAETRPFLSWDGSTLYFGSTAPASVRPQAEGANDIYMTTRSRLLGRQE
jgi:WD40-like Beta Propeller Repeat